MKINTISLLVIGAAAFMGCNAQAMEQTNSGPSVNDTDQTSKIQLILPDDNKVSAVVDAALPTIKKVLAIHPCIISDTGMLRLNTYALPGVSMRQSFMAYPNHKYNMKYHDHSECVSIRAIDNFTMPALNALDFRVVYFAEDSGETLSYKFEMRKAADGRWLLSRSPAKSK